MLSNTSATGKLPLQIMGEVARNILLAFELSVWARRVVLEDLVHKRDGISYRRLRNTRLVI